MIDSNNKRNSYRENTRGANQYDRQQIESVAKKYKIDKHSFGDFVENIKQSEGKGPSYTYKYSELEDLAKQFKELQP